MRNLCRIFTLVTRIISIIEGILFAAIFVLFGILTMVGGIGAGVSQGSTNIVFSVSSALGPILAGITFIICGLIVGGIYIACFVLLGKVYQALENPAFGKEDLKKPAIMNIVCGALTGFAGLFALTAGILMLALNPEKLVFEDKK